VSVTLTTIHNWQIFHKKTNFQKIAHILEICTVLFNYIFFPSSLGRFEAWDVL
jgi:hypothetical protein